MRFSSLFKFAAGAVLLSVAGLAQAADELALYVFRDSMPAEGLTAILDGGVEKQVGTDGGVYFDLSAGAHSVAIRDGGNTLHVFRFDAAASQYVDISVLLQGLDKPRVRIETHFKNETAAVRSAAATGTILGRVSSGGFPVPEAEITISKTGTTTTTDVDGNYRLVLPRGIYNLTISSPEYGSRSVNDLRVVAHVQRGASFTINPLQELGVDVPRPGIEEIFAVAKYNPVAQGENERYSQGIVDTLGIGELTRFGDSDISASVVRVPAVTVQDDQFIFIRGLGGRYVTTTLNGAQMPSPDPVKRSVPLDLFPTNVINQLGVKKTFIASMPGESTGGNLAINTRTFPAEGGGRFSFSTGYTSHLTGEDVIADPIRGDWDWLGYDDGTRDDNSALRGISDALKFSDFYPPAVEQELRRVGGILLKDDWDLKKSTANPLINMGGSYGAVFDASGGNEYGFFIAGNYKNDWNQRYDGTERTYDNAGNSVDDFSFIEDSNDVDLNGLASLGLTSGNNSYTSNTLYSNTTSSRAKRKTGFDGDALLPSIRHTIDWVERQFISQQLTGNHIFGETEAWTADWQATISRAERDSPNRREVRYDLQGDDGVYNLQVPNLSKRYDDLSDDNIDISTDFDYMIDISDEISSTVNFGISYIDRDRDSDSETYGYFGGQTLDDDAPNLKVSDVIDIDTITGDPGTGYAFLDKTLPSDSYEADLSLNSGFISLDTLFGADYQLIVGSRYEDFDQTTDTFQTEGGQEATNSRIDESVFLPTVAFNWILTEEQQLRFAASKTVARPDFKETANAVFFDPDFDIRVRGNPNLGTSDAVNLDIRYEYYWDDRDSVSVAAFYKDIDDPIERVVVPASGTAGNTRTFINADSADILGFEVDGRKEFGLNDALTRTFFLYGNYSWIDSDVDVAGGSRSLQGAPDYTFNLVLGFDDVSYNQELTVLFNQSGDAIVDVGVSGLPDIIQEPRLDVQLNYKWYFADDWQFRVKLENLLNNETEFTQGGQTYQEFKTGTKYEVGFNWDF